MLAVFMLFAADVPSTGSNLYDTLIALIALLGVVVPTVFAAKANSNAKTLKDKIETNHGKEPREYLEMVADVKETQLEMRQKMLELHEVIIDHTEQDARQFQEINASLKKLVGALQG